MSTRTIKKRTSNKLSKEKTKSSSREKLLDRCNFFAKGVRCPRRQTSDKYCDLHEGIKYKKVIPIPRTCEICTETSDKMKWFQCTHGCCSTCLSRLTDLSCPFCKAPLEGSLSKTERNQIKKNKTKREREEAQERHRASMNTIRSLGRISDDSSSETESWERDVREFAQQQRYLYPPPLFSSLQFRGGPASISLTPVLAGVEQLLRVVPRHPRSPDIRIERLRLN